MESGGGEGEGSYVVATHLSRVIKKSHHYSRKMARSDFKKCLLFISEKMEKKYSICFSCEYAEIG